MVHKFITSRSCDNITMSPHPSVTQKIFNLIILPPLGAPEVVNMTTYGAISDDKVI